MRVLFLAPLLAGLVSSQTDNGVHSCRCTGDTSMIPEDHEYYNTDYGLSCVQPWDAPKDYCNPDHHEFVAGNEKWCAEKWCYVDENCVVNVGDTQFVGQPTAIFKEYNISMWYSYETCGGVDYFNSRSWNFTITYAPVCSCTGSNEGSQLLEGSNTGKWCEAWDLDDEWCDPNSDQFDAGNELWCDKKWCYVQQGCQAEYLGRNWTSTRTVYDNDAMLWWSYETCGDPNYFSGSWNYSFAACGDVGRDVYFLVDSSDSVKNSWNYIRTAVSTLVGYFNGTNGDRVGLILFGGTGKDKEDDDYLVMKNLTSDITEVEDIAAGMDRLKAVRKGASPHTWTYGAINYTLDTWDLWYQTDNDVSENDNVKILVIVTDGKPNPSARHNPCDTDINHWHPRSELVAKGIKTLVFAIGTQIDELNCIVDDPAEDVIYVDDPQKFFEGLGDSSDIFCRVEQKVKPTARPTSSPTEGGCTLIPEPKDVVLVLDSSKSMYTKKSRSGTAKENWLATMVNLQNVVCLYNSLADQNSHRCAFGPRDNVGLVRFATDVAIEYDPTLQGANWWDGLQFTKTVNGVLEPALARKSLQFMTDTVAGLWQAFSMMEMINPVNVVLQSGDQRTKRREIILITDGRPHCKRDPDTMCRPCSPTWKAQTLQLLARADADIKMVWKGDRTNHDGRIDVDTALLGSDDWFGCLGIDFSDDSQFVKVVDFHEDAFRNILLGDEVCAQMQMSN